jgi:hypothetical protein
LMLTAITWPPELRYKQLVAIMQQEGGQTAPPTTLLAQGRWLVEHRQTQVLAQRYTIAILLVIGVAEGMYRRATDRRGGFLLTWWTIGVLAAGVALVGTVGYFTLPWPCPPLVAGAGLGTLGGASLYGLTAGRPYVA